MENFVRSEVPALSKMPKISQTLTAVNIPSFPKQDSDDGGAPSLSQRRLQRSWQDSPTGEHRQTSNTRALEKIAYHSSFRLELPTYFPVFRLEKRSRYAFVDDAVDCGEGAEKGLVGDSGRLFEDRVCRVDCIASLYSCLIVP